MTATIPIARPLVGEEEAAAVAQVLSSRWLTGGAKVAEFEHAFARWVRAEHAVAVSSGTTALHLALVAAGVAPGDEVVCPSLSFIATANAIVHAGARPLFAEVDERTFNLTPESVERARTARTRAVLLAHQVGLPADVPAIAEAAGSAVVIEDAACAVGAELRGVRIGRPHGALACFSFHPRKVMTTGEGGMITTSDVAIAERLRKLRNHGGAVGQTYDEVGWNYRLTDIQAAIGMVQLSRLEGLLARRREQAALYASLLARVQGIDLPFEPDFARHAWQSYVVRLREAERARVMERMAAAGVQTRPGIMAAHREPAYASATLLPITDALAAQTLALPLYHELSEADQRRVVAALEQALRE